MPIQSGSSTSAGVYAGEIDNSVRATAVPTSIGGIVGPARRGEVNKAVLVGDTTEFESRYGKSDPTLTKMHYCAKGFLGESSRLYVVRVAIDALLGGVRVATVNNFSSAIPLAGGLERPEDIVFDTADILYLYAANPGEWNNDLRVLLFPDVNDISGESFIIHVFEGSSSVPVEVHRVTLFDKLDGNGDQRNVETRLSEDSSRIRALVNEEHPGFVVNPRANLINAITPGQFTQGTDGAPVTDSDIIEAWDLFSDKEDLTVNLLINAGYTNVDVQIAMTELAEQRDDCFAILDAPSNIQGAQALVNWRRSVQNINTSYGALYAPDIKIRDTAQGRDIFIPPSGHVAGVFARTDADAAAWFAPAGLRRGQLDIIGLRETYKQGHRDLFAENQINPIISRPGEGYVVWGADTLQAQASSLTNINVRRLTSLLKTSIGISILIGVFDPNDTFLRREITNICESILKPIKEGRGLYSYTVVCDDRNNTNETIASGDLILDIYIDPVLPAKRIHLNAVIPKTGEIKFTQELLFAQAA
jgi:hypothetical protein